ncbi:MAG TPA: hypothetical protein VG498_22190, partial [Terriglobales bacterium]|nr:hypothetical protein [Terriglobales bacterium]
VFFVSLAGVFAFADAPGFDLDGPKLDVHVERAGRTLPISQVPNLEGGDRLWLHPDFPESQSTHYLLIVSFLRGATNPPPDEWFTKIESWDESVREEGAFVTVPKEAEQALVFFAPETGGDFSTLRGAVRGRPGAFVRAAQDLQQAGLDRMRLERYLAEIKSISESDPAALQSESALLARSLKMKLNQQCFDRPAEQQASCLTQRTDDLVLDDAHSQSMVTQLTSGATVDLMNQISYSRLGGGGAYSAYIGAVIDLARIMGSIHTAQYVYIPALAIPGQDSLKLKLNNPPSFRKPKSVLVVALPPVQKVQFPPLRPIDIKQKYCAETPGLLLPVEGAPLVFATTLAHDVSLELQNKHGKPINLPVQADPAKGGFVVDTTKLEPSALDADVSATVQGLWGFDHFRGPQFQFKSSHTQGWRVQASDMTSLVIGRDDKLHLAGQDVSCVANVTARSEDGKSSKLVWKASKNDEIEIDVPLREAKPGRLTIEISQYGLKKADQVSVQTYTEAAQFEYFTLNSGDNEGRLLGKRLDEVESVELNGIRFRPSTFRRENAHDELTLATDSNTAGLKPQRVNASVTLKDGRALSLPAMVLTGRPRVSLLSKGIQEDEASPSPIRLSNQDDLPTNARVVFFLKTVSPDTFPRNQRVEVAALDQSFKTILSVSDGSLVLQDAQTALGVLDPAKTFGASAFGSIQFRAVDDNGVAGDWQHLGTLVRLPELKEIRCPVAAAKTCVLTGSNLFLLTTIATNADLSDSADVPNGFTGTSLEVPRPSSLSSSSALYLKLRDDPTVVQSVSLPVVRDAANAGLNSPGESKSH